MAGCARRKALRGRGCAISVNADLTLETCMTALSRRIAATACGKDFLGDDFDEPLQVQGIHGCSSSRRIFTSRLM